MRPLLDVERAVLPTLVRARIATSTVLGAYSIAQDPTNDYLRVTAEPGWTTLAALSSVADDEFLSRCGI